MPRIAHQFYNYKKNQVINRKVLAIFLIGQAVTSNTWGVNISGGVDTIGTTANAPYLITAGTNGKFTVDPSITVSVTNASVITDNGVEPADPAVPDAVTVNTLGDYNINISGILTTFFNPVPTVKPPVIDMRSAVTPGTITIINGDGVVPVGSKSRIYTGKGSPVTVVPDAVAIDFTGATAKLVLTQNDTNQRGNSIDGNILGSNGGDTITLNAGAINGNIIFGTGDNTFNLYGPAALHGSINVPSGSGSNTINIIGSNPVVTGTITMQAGGANVLNVGTNQNVTTYTVGDNVTNIQTINVLTSAANPGTSFSVAKQITGVASFFADYNTTTNINGGSIVASSTSSTTDATGLNNGGTLIIDNNGKISGLDIVNNGLITVRNNSNINIKTLFTNNDTLNIQNNSDLSGVTINEANLTNASGRTITVDNNATIGKNYVLATVTNKGIINNNGSININSLVNDSAGTVMVNSGSTLTAIETITNNGILNIANASTVSAAGITQSGTMTIAGTVNSPITFPAAGNLLTINGGATKDIIGSTGIDIININGPVSTGGNISLVNNINLLSGIFTVKNNITGLSGKLSNAVGTTINIAQGDISGGGMIKNLGTLMVLKNASEGTIGATKSMGNVDNYGTFIAAAGDVSVNNFNNKLPVSRLEISSGNMSVNSLINNVGNISISGGDLSTTIIVDKKAVLPENYGVFTNGANQTITVSEAGTIGSVTPFTLATNKGIINIKDRAVVHFIAFNNSHGQNNNNSPVTLNITGGQLLIGNTQDSSSSMQNKLGTITISSVFDNAGDLSSASYDFPTDLTNYPYQTINVLGAGTIGNNFPLGNTINNGIINASGGNIFIGDITNGDAEYNYRAILNITQGTVFAGNISNTLGNISIFNTTDDLGNNYLGDLSSRSLDHATASSLSNLENQVVNVVTGTIGANGPLGAISNHGVMNINNNINVGTLDNASSNAVFNLTGGIARTSNITNHGNLIIISSGGNTDLSSINPLTPSTVTNNSTISVLGGGTIGANSLLGFIDNSGIINASGGNVSVGDFNNLSQNSIFNITSGNIKIGNITNSLGSITIDGGDVSSINASNHSFLTNGSQQIITISGNGTIGNASERALGEINNYGIFNAYGGNITIDSFRNSKTGSISVGGSLDLQSGTMSVGSINNYFGNIIIGGGDLSGINANSATLENGSNQVITISGTGTIGSTNRLGPIINQGTINANGSNIFVGDFTNNSATALLNITNGNISTGDINNIVGTIKIGDASTAGDLSGISNFTSSLTNASNQTIEIGGFGTVGAHNGLGLIINNGIINANTNIFKSLGLNNSKNSIFTITNNNTTGTVNGISLQSINNSGVISVYNDNHDPVHSIQDIHLGKFNNLSGGVFNINGKLTTGNNIINSTDAIININSNFDLGNNAYLLTNNGTVNMLCSATIENGNYLIGTTGSHVTTIDSGIPRTLTLRNGSATLASGSTIDINTTGNTFLQDQQQLTIIAIPSLSVVNDSIIADVNDVKINGNTGIVSYQLSKHNKDIIVTVNRKSIAEIMNSSDNGMAGNAGDLLDNLISNNISDPYLIAALSNIEKLSSKEEIINAVNQLSPSTEIAAVTLATNGVLVPEVVAQRLDFLARAGITHLKTGYAAGGMQIDDGLWIKGIGGTIEQKNFKGFAGYNANTIGVAFGADTRILPNTWIGLGLSSVGTHLKSKDYPAKKTNVSSYQVTAYSSYSPGNYYLDLLGAMAFNNYKTARNIKATDQTATAQFTGVQPSAKISLGYIQQQDGFRIIPNVSLQYSTLYQNPYNETGASGTGLQKVSSNNLSQLESGFGVKLAILDNEDSDHLYNPDIHFMVLHDFKAAPQETTAQFIGGGGSFKVQSTTPDKTTYNIGAGMVFMHKNRLNFTANYEWRKKNKFIGHSGSLSVRYEL